MGNQQGGGIMVETKTTSGGHLLIDDGKIVNAYCARCNRGGLPSIRDGVVRCICGNEVARLPKVARTQTKAIVQQVEADAMTVLPAFSFNSKRDWWEAPLDELGSAAKALAPCSLSRGAREWLNGSR